MSGGEPRFIPNLVRAAVAAGADALFLEVHPDPSCAPSDATNMLPLERLAPAAWRRSSPSARRSASHPPAPMC